MDAGPAQAGTASRPTPGGTPPRGSAGCAVRVRGLTWRPAGRRTPVLAELDLDLEPGERVLLAGPSGAGKSTLLRALAGVLGAVEPGDLTGRVELDGQPATAGGRAGLLLQEPGDALVAARVGRDVAFGPENLGLPRAQIWQRVEAVLASTRFPYPPTHPTVALSGGQTQRLALAGILALAPGLLLLDEPTSMLDPAAAAAVRAALIEVVGATGATLVVVDHRLGSWLEHVDRLAVLDRDGRLADDGPPAAVLARRSAELDGSGLWLPGLPAPTPLALDPDLVAPYPLHGPATGRRAAASYAGVAPDGPLLAAEDVVVRRKAGGIAGSGLVTLALDRVSTGLAAGAVTALTGDSGAGKSTLVQVLGGLLRPSDGRVRAAAGLVVRGRSAPWQWRSTELAARVGWVPQQPEHAMVARTVRDEVRVTGEVLGRPEAAARADALLEALGLSGRAGTDPRRLSGGEQRRLVLAAALAHGPAVLLLDEPTVGQDRGTWAAVAGVLAAARAGGAAVAVATHDATLVGALADHRVHLAGGRVAEAPGGDR